MNLQMKLVTSAIISLLIGGQYALAQSQETAPKENRLSIGLMGGVSTGHLNLGSAIEEGGYRNFDVQEQLNSTLGFNIRYAATKDIALQSNVMLGKFSLLSDYFHQEALSFKNNYITTSITTQLSLIRLLGAKSEYFNLYGSFGGGVMVNDVSISTTSEDVASRGITPSDHPSSTFFSTFGGGIRFNLGYRLDSFAQYDYHSASRDIIDGNFIGDLLAVNGAAETANSWSTVTVGLQYKFGSGSADTDWPGVAMRPSTPATTPERDVFEQLEDLLARQADFYEREIEQLSDQVGALQAELAEERRRREEEEERKQEEEKEEDPYAAILREMQSRIDSLEQALAEERKIAEPPVGQEEGAEILAETEAEADDEEELAEASEDITIGVKDIQPELFGNRVIDLQPDSIELESDNANAITRENLMGQLEIPDEELPAAFEDITIEKKEIRPELFGTRVIDLKPASIDFKPNNLAPITMEDLMGLLEIPGAEPAAEAEIADPADEAQVEELAATIEEPELIIEAEPEKVQQTEEEVVAAVVDEEKISEITFDEIMEFAKSIMIQESVTADTADNEEEMIAEVYEKFTEQQPEIRLLADSLTIIQALNELKRGLEEDSTIVISDLPDTHIETPKPEPKEVQRDDAFADLLDERALKTGGTPEVSDEEMIVEHPVEDFLKSHPEAQTTPSDDTIADSDELKDTEEPAADIEGQVFEEAPADELSKDDTRLAEEEQLESETDPADSERNNWPLFVAIAALFAGLLFYLSKFFKTEKDLDE